MGAEVFHALKGILKKQGLATSVGDEGGFAPNLPSSEAVIETILSAITAAGFKPGPQIALALDVAASELHEGKKYVFKKSGEKEKTSDQMIAMYESWVKKYPIISIEDGLGEGDWDGWKALTDALGKKCQIVGDDLFVTNPGAGSGAGLMLHHPANPYESRQHARRPSTWPGVQAALKEISPRSGAASPCSS